MVQPAILRKYNEEVKPQTLISVKAPITVETFLENIKNEYERRKPKSQQTPLTAEALSQLESTPSKSKKKSNNSGGHSPLGDILGLF